MFIIYKKKEYTRVLGKYYRLGSSVWPGSSRQCSRQLSGGKWATPGSIVIAHVFQIVLCLIYVNVVAGVSKKIHKNI